VFDAGVFILVLVAPARGCLSADRTPNATGTRKAKDNALLHRHGSVRPDLHIGLR